jgi:hypothetical protein
VYYLRVNYNGKMIRAEMEPDRAKYEAQLMEGQPPRYTPDQRTRDIWCLGKWIDAKLEGQERRIEMLWYFNRTVRAEEDPFEVAAVVMNTYANGEPLADWYQRYFRERKR